jgi:peptide/nickel transport system ATP-binding protein
MAVRDATTTEQAPASGSAATASGYLELRDVKVHFPTDDGLVKAVDGLSFTLDRGQTIGIVGESGSGKSVTSQAILGLHRRSRAQTSGSIFLDGEDLMTVSTERLRNLRGNKMAMIFQDPLSALHPYYTVGTQIVEGIRVHHSDMSKAAAKNRTIDLLGRVGIPNPKKRYDQYPHEFSGGMRQRAMIAMALANDPSLLIADEPTTALDVTVQAQILDLMRDLQQEFGSAIIMITHDLGVVAEIADDVLVMYAGRAVEYGSADQLFNRPAHPYTWGLLGSIPRFEGSRSERLLAIKGTPPSLINVPPGCPFHPRCEFAARNEGLSEEVRPELAPVEPGHTVACHLSPTEREQIWEHEIAPQL